MEVDGSKSDWKISIQERVNQANEDYKSIKCRNVSIYRAPHDYREVNRGCFEPKIVSLGPYHSSNPKLRKANPYKWRALHYMLKRNEQEVGQYLDAMMELEPQARNCYEEDISQNKNEFVEMMVLDGSFIIEFLLCITCSNETLGYPDSHPFYDGTVSSSVITSDILLLENQIPICVLEKLAQQQKEPVGVESITNRAIWMFNNFMSPVRRDPYDDANDRNEGIKGDHILDIVRLSVLPKISNPDTDEKDDATSVSIPSASQLKETRVKFKAWKGHPFLKVNFSDQTLELTQLHLVDRSKTLFCNLIAYEQRHHDPDKFITGYFMFLGQLVDSPEDVRYLIERKIICNMIGRYNEVVDLFDKTTRKAEFSLENSYPQRIVKSINEHLDSTWYQWRANLINTYFKNPWSTLSIVAAFLLLVFTFIQTLYAVYGYYSQKKS